MTNEELYNVQQFGGIPCGQSLDSVMNRFNQQVFRQGIYASHHYRTLTSKASDTTVDISGFFGNSWGTTIDSSTQAYVLFFSGKSAATGVTVYYSSGASADAYSSNVTDSASVPYAPYLLFRWLITAENFSNNTKLRIKHNGSSSSSQKYSFSLLIYFRGTGT